MAQLLFNVFVHGFPLFILNTDLVRYAEDIAPFAMDGSELEVINEIKSAAESLSLRFQNNCVKVNPDKFHLLLLNGRIFIWWILVMRSSKVLAVKTFNALTFILPKRFKK